MFGSFGTSEKEIRKLDLSIRYMVKAVVHGETHSSEKDKKALMDRDLSRFDAIFIEDFDRNYFNRNITLGYALFAIGHLVAAATLGRSYVSKEDFRQKAKREGIPIYEVDAAIYEVYDMVPRWKRVVMLLLSPFGALFFFTILAGVIQWLSIPVPALIGQFIAVLGLLFLFGFLVAFQYFVLIENEVLLDRDEYMAEEVLRVTDENGYESVLVNCGDKHRSGITSLLEEQDWEVDPHPTQSWLGKALILIERIGAALLNPGTTARKIVTKIRNTF